MAKKSPNKTKLERTPIVAVMGHVDHGKTSILDAIRKTNVQEKEAGGITQNTRAHQIVHNGQKITFIDTPGHEAFSEMRSRGAQVTDIVLIVIAADDGIQPQTRESIEFAKKSKVPMIIVINKIDLTSANVKKVKQSLLQYDIQIEEFGGDVLLVEVSAKQKKNLDELLDTIILQAELLELKTSKVAQGLAEAFVLESTLDSKKGPSSLIIVKAGTITIGDFIIHSKGFSKIRALITDDKNSIQSATEGDTIMLIGLDEVLPTGEVLLFEKTQKASELLYKKFSTTEEPIIVPPEKEEVVKEKSDEEEKDENLEFLSQLLNDQEKSADVKHLNIVLKTDTQGTLEAVTEKLNELSDDEVIVNILHSGTGNISERDILTAKDSKGIVIGFQINIPTDVVSISKREKVLLRNYEIIYTLLEEVNVVVESMKTSNEEITEIARSKIKKVFILSNGKSVAGCKITKGTIRKGYKCFILRDDEEIGDGRIVSLKHNKKEVKEMKKDHECGIIIEPSVEFEKGDEIVCYKKEK